MKGNIVKEIASCIDAGLLPQTLDPAVAMRVMTVGVIGGLIGIPWSLAISAMILLAVTIALFALVIPGRGSSELSGTERVLPRRTRRSE